MTRIGWYKHTESNVTFGAYIKDGGVLLQCMFISKQLTKTEFSGAIAFGILTRCDEEFLEH